MKKFLSVLSCFIICVCCIFAASCAGGHKGNDSAFVFLSVRIKGNGDGTVCAVAQNEFAIGSSVLPVTLSLYSAETFETDVDKMIKVQTISSEDLNIYKKLNIVANVETQSYFCARITYTVNGEIKNIQSDTVLYATDGKRIK